MDHTRVIVGMAVLALLTFRAGPAGAIYGGTVSAEVDALLEVTPETSGTTIGLTISYLNRKGNRVRDIDIATITPSAPSDPIPLHLPTNTSRVYIELDLDGGLAARVRVIQGTTIITRDVAGDGRVMLDVLPEP